MASLQTSSNPRLDSLFFKIPCQDLAKELLGKLLVRKIDDSHILKAKIVETECYLGGDDKASHSYNFKQTDRNAAMFMEAGTIYVYPIYGMYWCFNISSEEPGAAVLIRSLEPIYGVGEMLKNRMSQRKENAKELKEIDICNGPSKLCQAFKIDKSLNQKHLSTCESLWIENCERIAHSSIVSCKRIGIDSCGPEWSEKPLRYYILNNKFVSKRNKKAETNLQ